MPSPKELAALKKWADNSDDLYFVVNEVVECETSSDEEQDESLLRDKAVAKDMARREKLVGKGFVCSKVIGGEYNDNDDDDDDDDDDERRKNDKKELENRDESTHLANAKIAKEVETNAFCSNGEADVEGGAGGGDTTTTTTTKDEYNVD